jgi:hypothetical protein
MSYSQKVFLSQNVPVESKYDVIVCGGGPSGFIAAISAARNGAKVALIERYSFLGGLATAGLVAPISEFNKNGQRIVDGIPWEFVEQLSKLDGADLSYPIGNVPYDPEVYKLVAQRMVMDAGVSLFLGCEFIQCSMENNKITHVICKGKTGIFALEGSIFIDCTGDAELAFCAKAPFQETPSAQECQPASLCFRLGNVDTAKLENICFREPSTKYSNSRIRELLNNLRETIPVPIFGGPWFHWAMHDGIVVVNMTRSPVYLNDALKASEIECQLREDVFTLVDLLKKHVPEFKDAFVIQTGIHAGYRESRRILGCHVLTGKELLNAVTFEDSIARSAHPVDIHRPNDSEQDVHFLSEAGYIPYRSIIMKSHPNLFVAGRCISADRIALASIRVQAPAMAIGQAAGTAAALCIDSQTLSFDLNVKLLQKKLTMQNAKY